MTAEAAMVMMVCFVVACYVSYLLGTVNGYDRGVVDGTNGRCPGPGGDR